MAVLNPKLRQPQFKFAPFSKKQLMVLGFWDYPKYKNKIDAIICDGSVRSGKTLSMIISYVEWSMNTFNGKVFGVAGQSVGSLRKNVIEPMKTALAGWSGFDIKDNRSEGKLTITFGKVINTFYLYGGKDESSYRKVQGLTAAGFFFDEVALQPQSFVNQATSRVDDEKGLFWFNCNPAGPYHWFYQEWIVDSEHKHHCFHLHFTMDDNLYLTDKVKDRYRRSYSGVFYDRYILGKWVMAEGIVYSNFDKDKMIVDCPPIDEFTDFTVSVDYGDQNPTTFQLWGWHPATERWIGIREYYHDGRHHTLSVTGYPTETNVTEKSDQDYANDMIKFLDGIKCPIVIDPSARNFAIMLRKNGINTVPADNSVIDGIQLTRVRFDEGKLVLTNNMPNLIRELGSYCWDLKAADKGEDKVIKKFDHGCDSMRYMVVYRMPPVQNLTGYNLSRNY